MPGRPILLALLLAACGGAAAAALPDEAAILPQQSATGLLNQCSRGTPDADEGTWPPSPDDIAALERALPTALAAQGRPELAQAPQGWKRQYVGIVRSGRRYIYGNFFPEDVTQASGDPERWRREPVIVCDGGPSFFGIEYDVDSGRFTHFGFNGMA